MNLFVCLSTSLRKNASDPPGDVSALMKYLSQNADGFDVGAFELEQLGDTVTFFLVLKAAFAEHAQTRADIHMRFYGSALKSRRSAFGSMRSAFGSMRSAFKSMRSAFKSMRSAFKSMRSAFKSMRSAFKSMRSAFKSMRSAFKSMRRPSRA